MSLKIRKEWVDGPDGEPVEKEFYYMETSGSKLRERMTRGTPKSPAGYTWSMGYNNCVGRYSPGGSYSRLSGSSINRKKNGDSKKALPAHNPDLPTSIGNIVSMARKVQKRMSEYRGKVPGAFIDLVGGCDEPSKERFRLWISEQMGRDVQPVGYGIHMLSARSRGKIRDKATAFFRACPGDRIFCTLTFIAAVDDQTGVSILNKYLTSLRKAFPKIQYLWVAERQENNEDFPDNIHFHIILNKRLPVRRWNALWVLQQYNAGLTGKNKYDERVTAEEIDRRFLDGTIHKVFNPMDVKRVKSIGGLSMYLTKYITKQKKNVPFSCAVWHCSRRVSRVFTRATVGPSAFRCMSSFRNCRVDMDTGECFPPKVVKEHFYMMAYVHDKKLALPYLREMEQVNKWILQGFAVEEQWLHVDDDGYRKRFCKTENDDDRSAGSFQVVADAVTGNSCRGGVGG
jgi:hypothetical protein